MMLNEQTTRGSNPTVLSSGPHSRPRNSFRFFHTSFSSCSPYTISIPDPLCENIALKSYDHISTISGPVLIFQSLQPAFQLFCTIGPVQLYTTYSDQRGYQFQFAQTLEYNCSSFDHYIISSLLTNDRSMNPQRLQKEGFNLVFTLLDPVKLQTAHILTSNSNLSALKQ